jgi:hypothetical protein
MFQPTLGRFRSIHALEEMAEDDVLTEDVQNVILTGGIVERQIDRATRERKYVFLGRDLAGDPIGVVAKIGAVDKVVVLTVYREETS